jgi:hypothetical protein
MQVEMLSQTAVSEGIEGVHVYMRVMWGWLSAAWMSYMSVVSSARQVGD